MKRLLPLLLVATSLTAAQAPQPVDLLYLHGRIFTGDAARPWAEAMAVRGERIVAVGSDSEVQSGLRAARTIDLRGRLLIPGINDAHDHPGAVPFGMEAHTRTPPPQDPGLDELTAAIADVARQAPRGSWIQVVAGAKAMADAKATVAAMDAATRDHAVMVKSWWGHGVILNQRGLAVLGITEATVDQPGGHYERDAANHLTGKLEEYAGWDVLLKLHSSAGLAAATEHFRSYAASRLAEGVTSVQAMAGYLAPALFVQAVAAAGSPLRFRLVPFPIPSAADPRGMAEWDRIPRHPAAGIDKSGIKWVADGTPFDLLAWYKRSYRPGWFGRMNFDGPMINGELRRALDGGEQLLLHTVGDATQEYLLEEMEMHAPAARWKARRVRMEHAEFTGPEAQRAAALGIVVGQPRPSAPLRAMLAAGITVAYGSDEGFRPFAVFQQMTSAARPQSITREQALAVMTSAGAWAEFAERDKGRLQPGMLADFAVLSQDLFEVPEAQLPATRSLHTVVGGKVAYQAPDF